MYKEGFSSRLKKARELSGFTQQEVANETKITRSTLARYEVGINEPDIERIGTLAEFYGVSIDWLFGIGKQGRNPNYYEEMGIKNNGKARKKAS